MGNAIVKQPLGICSDGPNLNVADQSSKKIYMMEYSTGSPIDDQGSV